jgi:PPOX class probable F420-dependent enzyme
MGQAARTVGLTVTTLTQAAELGLSEQGLAVVSTLRADSTIQSSLVNAGVLAHPVTGEQVLGFVTYGKVKLANLRARPQVTTAFRSGWRWATVEGVAELVGPADPYDGVDAERLRLLLRGIFAAAGGTHDNWDEYDRVMLEQGRTAVLVRPTRVYSN